GGGGVPGPGVRGGGPVSERGTGRAGDRRRSERARGGRVPPGRTERPVPGGRAGGGVGAGGGPPPGGPRGRRGRLVRPRDAAGPRRGVQPRPATVGRTGPRPRQRGAGGGAGSGGLGPVQRRYWRSLNARAATAETSWAGSTGLGRWAWKPAWRTLVGISAAEAGPAAAAAAAPRAPG